MTQPRAFDRRQWLELGTLGWLGTMAPRFPGAETVRTHTPQVRSCVLFLLHGGPSQLDIWDMKPAAPPEVRGAFRPVATSVPGMQITEHLPRLAQLAHRFR